MARGVIRGLCKAMIRGHTPVRAVWRAPCIFLVVITITQLLTPASGTLTRTIGFFDDLDEISVGEFERPLYALQQSAVAALRAAELINARSNVVGSDPTFLSRIQELDLQLSVKVYDTHGAVPTAQEGCETCPRPPWAAVGTETHGG